MRSLRQSYWFIQGFFLKYKKTILASFLAFLGMALVLFFALPRIPTPKRHLYVGVIGKYTLSQIPPEIEHKLGMGLTTIGSNLSPEPGLASRWEIENEGKNYRFYLNENLTWSNGEPLVLNDLEFVIPDVEVIKHEPNVIEFKLPEAFSPFPSVLSKPVVKAGTLTSGEYTIRDIQVNGPYISLVELESEKEKVTYRFYDTSSQAILAFKLGQVDQLDELLSKPEEAGWPNVLLTEVPRTDLYVAVFYNTANALLADKSLRQGLSYAIENKAFSQLRALSSVNPKSWAYNKTVKTYDLNAVRAEELVKKATPPDQKLVIELATTPELLFVAESIKSDWEKVGVKADVKVVSSAPENFQAMIKMVTIPSDPDQYTHWHSTQETNFTNFANAKVDKLLEDGRQILKIDERKLVYHDFQRFLVEEVPATFLYHPTTYTLVRKSKSK